MIPSEQTSPNAISTALALAIERTNGSNYFDPKLRDTSFVHVTRNLLTSAKTYTELVEAIPSSASDPEVMRLERTARNDLTALGIYLRLVEENTGFFIAEETRKDGFYSQNYRTSTNSRLYVAKAKLALKRNQEGQP